MVTLKGVKQETLPFAGDFMQEHDRLSPSSTPVGILEICAIVRPHRRRPKRAELGKPRAHEPCRCTQFLLEAQRAELNDALPHLAFPILVDWSS